MVYTFVCLPLQRHNAPHRTFITACLKNEWIAQGSVLLGQEDQKLICTSGWMVIDFREEHCDSCVTTLRFRMIWLLSSQQLSYLRQIHCRACFSSTPSLPTQNRLYFFIQVLQNIFAQTNRTRPQDCHRARPRLIRLSLLSLWNSHVGFEFNFLITAGFKVPFQTNWTLLQVI